jgi:asparagine synthase (glutamine-hydrolysing)
VSALVALLGYPASPETEATARRLLAAMPQRKGERVAVWSRGEATLAVSRRDWECDSTLAGPCVVAERGSVVAICDASIYYRRDLRSRLAQRGVECASDSPSDLVLAAYAAWGDECATFLDGDFAFVIWDIAERRAIVGRDHVGRRPLHLWAAPGRIVMASAAQAVAAHPDVPRRVNRLTVAAALSGLLGGSLETGFEGIEPIAAATTVSWTEARGVRVVQRWEPPEFSLGGEARTLHDAAAELQSVLGRAVAERSATRTVVWLSGGADSTAVFAAGNHHHHTHEVEAQLTPVSISYPPGDSAREDDFIAATARRWNATVHWLDSEGIDLFEDFEARAEARDDPYAHTFEAANRALASASVDLGARVALDGFGGDQLFQVSYGFLADLFWRLRWWSLGRVVRAGGLPDLRSVVRWGVLPVAPRAVHRVVAVLRGGRPVRSVFDQSIAPWIAKDVATDEALLERSRADPPRRAYEGAGAHESRWYLTTPYFARSVTWASTAALVHGVDVRSPLLDRRVIEIAARRPLLERTPYFGGKPMLREASRGLVPDEVLKPRTFKTGVPKGYLGRQLGRSLAAALSRTFDVPAGGIRLVDLRLIDNAGLKLAIAEQTSNPEHIRGVQLFLTLSAEWWLRGHGF